MTAYDCSYENSIVHEIELNKKLSLFLFTGPWSLFIFVTKYISIFNLICIQCAPSKTNHDITITSPFADLRRSGQGHRPPNIPELRTRDVRDPRPHIGPPPHRRAQDIPQTPLEPTGQNCGGYYGDHGGVTAVICC